MPAIWITTGCGGMTGAAWGAVLWTVEVTLVGTGAGLVGFGCKVGVVTSFCAACCALWVTLPEIVCEMPLPATVVSVGMAEAPPEPPGCPSSCWVNSASSPGGTGTGGEGAAPGPLTVIMKPGLVRVWDTPPAPVTVRPLP